MGGTGEEEPGGGSSTGALCTGFTLVYLVATYFLTCLPIIETYFLQKWSPINSIEVHPQLSHNGHPVDGELVGAGSCT